MHTSFHPTLQHHNRYKKTDNYRQWNAVGSPDDGRKDARNMLRYYSLPINHYLLHLVGLTLTYLSKMHGHSNIKSVLVSFVGSFFSYLNDARSHERELLSYVYRLINNGCACIQMGILSVKTEDTED